MDFIFMLTRHDLTVEDCLDVFEAIKDSGLKHIGFKDIGVPIATLKELLSRMKVAGMTTYLEVVSETEADVLRSARAALEMGVDRLMGGTCAEKIMAMLRGSSVRYFPWPGIPVGRPTRLGGTAELVEQQCRHFMELGCAGIDLLAYRATEADPLDLVKAAVKGFPGGHIICAGSINSRERIRALREAGVHAFTIGTAVFDGSYSPRKGHILAQIEDVLADLATNAIDL
jgi:hypothetical protein